MEKKIKILKDFVSQLNELQIKLETKIFLLNNKNFIDERKKTLNVIKK